MSDSPDIRPLPWISVVPTVDDGGVVPMSPRQRSRLLSGLDPTLVLEAASTVLGEIERSEDQKALWTPTVWRLPEPDRRSLETWVNQSRREGSPVASSPVHPLAVVAAMKLALGQASPGARSDDLRETVAGLLTQVALRFNDDVVGADLPSPEGRAFGPNSEAEEEELRCVVAGTTLWAAVERQDWMILSAELIRSLGDVRKAKPTLAAFEQATGLTLAEWFSRSLGERATRHIHGARSWGSAKAVDEALNRAWEKATAISPEAAVERSAPTIERYRDFFVVKDVFDLGWLAENPFILTADGRRFSMWLGAVNRYLVPAEVVRMLSISTGVDYDKVATWMGLAGAPLLAAAIEAAPLRSTEFRIPDEQIDTGSKKADYVIGDGRDLLVIDFTIISPTRTLSQGVGAGVDHAVEKLAGKFEQVYTTLRWCDPDQAARWLPLVVLLSPTAMGVNDLVHQRLVDKRIIQPGDPELMVCHATDFLDLVEYAKGRGISLARAVAEWRSGPRDGKFLDWWLFERGASGASSRLRIKDVMAECQDILRNRSVRQAS